MIFNALNGCLGAGSHLRNSLGRKPPRFVSSPECCPLGSKTSRRGPELYKLTSPISSQVSLRSSTQPVALRQQFPSLAPTFFSLTTRKVKVLATPTLLRSLAQNRSDIPLPVFFFNPQTPLGMKSRTHRYLCGKRKILESQNLELPKQISHKQLVQRKFG